MLSEVCRKLSGRRPSLCCWCCAYNLLKLLGRLRNLKFCLSITLSSYHPTCSEPVNGAHYRVLALQLDANLIARPCPCRDLQAAHLKLAKLQSDWEAREAEKAQAGKRAEASANVSREMSSKDAAAPSEAPPSEPVLPAVKHLPSAAEGMTHKLHSLCFQECHRAWLGSIIPGWLAHQYPLLHASPVRGCLLVSASNSLPTVQFWAAWPAHTCTG